MYLRLRHSRLGVDLFDKGLYVELWRAENREYITGIKAIRRMREE
jgi:hypothetical protein